MGERIDVGVIKNAATIAMMYFILFFAGGMTISVYEGLPLSSCLFEAASAVGTVGLSRGLTAVLNTPAKWIVIFTMYLGRIGPLTLGAAVVSRAQKRTKDVHLAEENIMIG